MDITREIRNSAKALVIRDGCLLAVRNMDAEGDWYLLPGGGQYPGESLHRALQRECREELGTSVTIGDLKLIREYIGKNHEFAREDGNMHQIEFMFECTVPFAYRGATGEHPDAYQTGVSWLPIEEIERYRLYPKILKTLVKNGLEEAGVVYLGDTN